MSCKSSIMLRDIAHKIRHHMYLDNNGPAYAHAISLLDLTNTLTLVEQYLEVHDGQKVDVNMADWEPCQLGCPDNPHHADVVREGTKTEQHTDNNTTGTGHGKVQSEAAE